MVKVISTVDHIQEECDKNRKMHDMYSMPGEEYKMVKERESYQNPQYGKISEALTKEYASEKTGKNG